MSEQEDYTYPGTHVLKNKADIRDFAELQRFERGATAIRIQELREKSIRGDYDLAHLQAIHKQVFKDVYAWAGEVRNVDIAKGPAGDRTLFTFKEDIPQKAAEIQATIKAANHLRGLDKEQFSNKMAEVYAGVNEMHPFREGNGRSTREFVSQLAKEAGYQLDYSKVDKQAWNEAAKQSARGNLEPARDVFYEITTVERAVAFDKLKTREALAHHPELDGAYKMLAESQGAGQDVAHLRAEISKELHAGRLVGDGVTVDESRRVIDHAAASRGLMVRDAAHLGGRYQGDVVAVSSHHAMLKVGDMIAVRYERAHLERELAVGERVTIQYDQAKSRVYERGKEPAQERGRDMQIERERVPNPR
ncbi:Fic/DOC family protein (plasmid) [Ralstonia pseudosolanacearum]